MAVVPYLEQSDLPDEDRDLLARPINLVKATANSPAAARQLHAIGHWIRWECELDARWRELAILTVGYLSRAEYEWSHHLKIGMSFGVTHDDINALIAWANDEPQDHLSEADLAVLSAARELTVGTQLTDETLERLTALLPNDRLVDLVTVVAQYNCVVRILGALRIDVEPEYQSYLDEYPLPLS